MIRNGDSMMKLHRKKRGSFWKKRIKYFPVVPCVALTLLLTGCEGEKPVLPPGESYLADLETRDVAELQKEIRQAKAQNGTEPKEQTEDTGENNERETEEGTSSGSGESRVPDSERESGQEISGESETETEHSGESQTDPSGEEARRARFEALMADLKAQVESGEAKELTPEEIGRLKSKLEGTVIIGDSMAQAAIEYNLMPETSVFFQRGGITRELGPVTEKAVALYPENVIFFTGLNDADHETYDSYPEAYAERVAQVRAALPDAKIWICSMTPPSDALGAVREDLARAPVFDQVLEAWCAASPDATYVDLKWLVRQDWYMADGIHFKRSFYLIWLQYLEGLLEESGSL